MSNTPSDLKYTKSHEWVRDNGDGTVTLGITDHAQELLSGNSPPSHPTHVGRFLLCINDIVSVMRQEPGHVDESQF